MVQKIYRKGGPDTNSSHPPETTILMTSELNKIAHRPKFPIIVTAYTVTSHLGNYYKNAVARFTKSCIKHDLKHIVYPLDGVDNWIKGCNLKPTIILDALEVFRQPILWIDADATIVKHPTAFDNPDFDMALHAQNGHWLSGTLYFSHNAIDFVREWKKITVTSTPDEITLLNLYNNRKNNPKIKMLPSEYNQIIHSDTDMSKLIIGHYIRPDIAPNRGVEAILPDEL